MLHGTAVRDFIHVADLARSHIAALATATASAGKIGDSFRTFNLGTGKRHTVCKVLQSIPCAVDVGAWDRGNLTLLDSAKEVGRLSANPADVALDW